MTKPLTNIERARYETIWAVPEYNQISPGEGNVSLFGQIVNPRAGETLIDFGCGKGLGGQRLRQEYGLDVTYLDLVKVGNCPEPHIQQSLWEPIQPNSLGTKRWNYGYCSDVMEHIPKEFTMLAAKNMLDVCDYVFFVPAFYQETHGPRYMNEPLHLTIECFVWWRDRFMEVGTLLDGRDLLTKGVFYVKS